MTELLPCPFCGGEASVFHLHAWWISHSCDVLGEYIKTTFYDTEAEAISAWNTSSAGTCHKANINEPDWFVCSECGCQTKGDQYGELPKFCSNCGKKVSA